MNLYFLVEGQRCEPSVYRAWIKHTFPQLSRVQRLEDVHDDTYIMIAGRGYPDYLKRIGDALLDVASRPVFDHFFICIDAEDRSYEERFAEVSSELHKHAVKSGVREKCPKLAMHVVVQDCCIETWFLGNREMVRPAPSAAFGELLAFYDVSQNDPEELPRHPQKPTSRARFHKHYLKEMLRDAGHSYSEQFPGVVKDPAYLKALRSRCETTTHLRSLRHLLSLWDRLAAS